MMDAEINNAIREFENFNSLQIKDYCSSMDIISLTTTKMLDDYIAESVFFDRINKWLMICENDEHKKEFLKLLSCYSYITYRDYVISIVEALKNIDNSQTDSMEDVLFISIPAKNNKKSGGDEIRSAINMFLKGRLIDGNIRSAGELSNAEVQHINKVVFVDDIIGSGQSMYGVIKHFYSQNLWLDTKKIYIICVCGRQKKLKKLQRNIKRHLGLECEIFCSHELKKCYANETLSLNHEIIEYYEENINKEENIFEYDDEGDCFLGYKKNQLLVSFFYSTPNNTLSLFWRKTKYSPNPLFYRASKRKNTLNNIIKESKQNKENSYNLYSV